MINPLESGSSIENDRTNKKRYRGGQRRKNGRTQVLVVESEMQAVNEKQGDVNYSNRSGVVDRNARRYGDEQRVNEPDQNERRCGSEKEKLAFTEDVPSGIECSSSENIRSPTAAGVKTEQVSALHTPNELKLSHGSGERKRQRITAH
jgi:hypothetical protein